ncbi:Fibroblast growth factor receptor [Clonorchis sinensis]|uniref:Fibroblast growth factor receptor n=1 Tax=Clonorchis sinensis TaxID=79923 RepID=A0A8T1MHK4_CLOSI|nr:Fibroblast growth factor receptor [Clonorchis sinensis]
MLQSHLVARYLFFVLAIDGAHALKSIPQSMYSPLSLQCACNPNRNAVPTWWHNDMQIKQRKGKHILRSATLHILDLRMNDSGIYRCVFTDPANELHKCAGYNISVLDPTPRSLALHERTAPADAATERSGEVYWHPKMKREDGQHVFKGQPVTLEVFIYSSGSAKPIVQWFGPVDHFDTAPTISEPQKFNCNTPEETQRVLNGTCYRASYTIHRLPAGAEFMCEVKSGALTNASVLYTNFIVFESYKVSEDPYPISERRRPRFETLAMDDIADLILQVLDPNVTEPTEPTKPTLTSTESPSISSSLHPPVLNFASLRPTEIPDLHFFLLSPTACLRGNLTLHCQLPGLASELEVWYLGPKREDHSNQSSHCLLDGCFDVDPVFIRRSGSTLFKLRSDSGRIREMVHFDETPLSITLAGLGTQHSGTYLCKYINHYKLVHVEVKECDDQAIKFDFRQLVVLLMCFGAIFILLILFAVWIRSRRKPVVVELVSRAYRAKGFTSKPTRKLNLMCHFHDLYPPDTTLRTAFGNTDAYNKQCDSVHTAISAVSNERYRHRKRIFKKPTVSAMYRLSPSFSHCAAWEVDASCILIEQLIAEGNFSSVYQATVHGPLPRHSHVGQNISDASTHVAVKTVRAAYNVEDLISLFREIQIMVLLNAHPHIIRLMGICTQNGCPRILLEYAVHGNMRDFLRQNRPSDSASVDDVEVPSINSSLDLISTPELVKLNAQALLRFGYHVADALTYLESLKLVHRDIAARNVLVTEGYVAKLCDFGLSCPLVDGNYVDEFRERLPFRWMAPESLQDNRFSLKSDVWSFGIYLWELFSLGYTPYPGLSCADIGPWLAAGYRNAQPSMASAEVYRIMLDCWHTEPSLRPSVKSLLGDLKLLLSSTLRSSSRDSGFTSGNRSRQTSGTNPSTSSSVSRPRPVPPVRTVSLPGYTNLPEGYVEMSLEGYLEPRSELRSADLVAA